MADERSRLSPQRLADWLRARLVPRLEASDWVSEEATALVDELLRPDRDPDRPTRNSTTGSTSTE